MSTNIYSLVDSALTTLGQPYAWQKYLTAPGAALPDAFVVATDVTNTPTAHHDDAETSRFYRVQISSYSRNGLAAAPNADSVMLAAGFRKSNQVSLPFEESTGHFGLATDYTLLGT